ILNTPGRAIPLRRLFNLKQYPPDVMVLYAEGYSVTDFLVAKSSRFTFLAFVNTGMQQGWDAACQTHYGYKNVEELEAAWLQTLRDTKAQARQLNQSILASRNPGGGGDGGAKTQVVTRTTAPPAQPVIDTPRPAYRGQMEEEQSTGGWNAPQVRLGTPQLDLG